MPDLYGWYCFQKHGARVPCAWSELPSIVAAAGVGLLYVSTKWFAAPSLRDAWLDGERNLAYRYWLWVDIDAPKSHAERDAAAFAEGAALWRWTFSEKYHLRAGRDLRILGSGMKGLKFVAGSLTPCDSGWADAAKVWLEGLAATSGFVDTGMATVDVARAPGSRHPDVEAWQNWVTPNHLAGPPDAIRAILAEPLDEDSVLDLYPDPDRPPTPELAALFDEIRTAADEAERWRIWTGKDLPSHGSATPQPEAWEQALATVGLLKRAHLRTPEQTFFRLTDCPACGKAEGEPYVTAYGRLVCRRATCPASRAHGLLAPLWAPAAGVTIPPRQGHRTPSGTVPRSAREALAIERGDDLPTTTAPLALPDAQREVANAVRSILDSPPNGTVRVLRTTPGVGKTYATVQALADRAGDERVIIGVSTHELGAEIARDLDAALGYRLPAFQRVVHLHGRSDENCERFTEISALANKGWEPGRFFCPGCAARRYCDYYAAIESDRDGARSASYIVTTYVQALALLASNAAGQISKLILDEDPCDALFTDATIGPDNLKPLLQGPDPEVSGRSGWPLEITLGARLLDETLSEAVAFAQRRGAATAWNTAHAAGLDLHRLFDAAAATLARWNLVPEGTSAGEILLRAAEAAQQIHPHAGSFAVTDRAAALAAIDAVPSRLVLRAFDVLARDQRVHELADAPRDFLGRAVVTVRSSGAARLLVHLRNEIKVLPDLILDAYADQNTYAAAWRHPVEVHDVAADLSHAAWIRITANGSRTLLLPDGAKPSTPKQDATREEAWTALADALFLLEEAGHTEILIVTHGSSSGDDRAIARCHQLAPHADVRWFWSMRGVNTFSTHTAVIVFGVPEAPPDAYLHAARRLFGGTGEAPLSARRSAAHLRLYQDPRLQALVDATREAEVAQLAHRIRPAIPRSSGPRPAVVIVGAVDPHMLPELVDLPPRAVRLAAWHLRTLQTHRGSLLALSAHLDPAGTTRVAAPAALAAAAALVGARPAQWQIPAEDLGINGPPHKYPGAFLPTTRGDAVIAGPATPPASLVAGLRLVGEMRRAGADPAAVDEAVRELATTRGAPTRAGAPPAPDAAAAGPPVAPATPAGRRPAEPPPTPCACAGSTT